MLTERIRGIAFWCLVASVVTVSFSISLFEISSGLFLGFAALPLFLEKRWDVFKNALGVCAAAYLIATALSMVGSLYPQNTFRGFWHVIRCVAMLFFTGHLVNDKNKFKIVFGAIVFTAFAIALDALWQGVSGVEILRGKAMTRYTEEINRITGPFNHANDFSAYICQIILVFYGMILYTFKEKNWKVFFFFLAGGTLLTVSLVWTYSRAAWLAVAAAVFLMAIAKKSRGVLLAILVVLCLFFLLAPPALKGRFSSLWNSRDGTTYERRVLWQESLDMTAARPWFGHGINTYSQVEPLFKDKSVRTDAQYAHNGYLQIAAETGWVGLAAFLSVILAFFLTVFKPLFRLRATEVQAAGISLGFSILAFLMHSAADTDLQSLRLVSFFWISMGLVLASKKILQTDNA